jgi:hypothetical protein
MSDKPILFSAPMIRALLAGTKTQTRRILKPQPDDLIEGQIPKQLRISIGDVLWVRERGWLSPSKLAFQPYVGNEDTGTPENPDGEPYKVCVSIHMPRWASRLTLTVTDVRVERLQEISERDCIAEGIEWVTRTSSGDFYRNLDNAECPIKPWGSYRSLWNHINGACAWDANPWIAAYTFTVHRGNIDQMAKEAA